MPTYLAATLYAPLAAFGSVAVGERRGAWDRPGRSALMGVLAAALGIDRAEETAHQGLEAGYGVAIRTDAPGRLLADYHTAQVPPARRNQRFATRAEELAAPDLGTILTRREYRSDALHMVVWWERDHPPYALAQLQVALCQPAFLLFCGRKSCPFGLPLDPRLIEAGDPAAAIDERVRIAAVPEQDVRQRLCADAGTVTMDADAALALGLDIARIEHRRDRLVSRQRWQFAVREEAVLRRGTRP